MDQQLEQFIEDLVQECLVAVGFSGLSLEEKIDNTKALRTYFDRIVITNLVENLTEEQLKELDTLQVGTPEFDQKLADFTASIPGFILLVSDKLEEAAEKIKKSKQVPE